jgi:hypothetical protein
MMSKKYWILAFTILAFVLPATARFAAAQTAKADYRFQNDRASSLSGAPDLTDLGAGGANTFTVEEIDGAARTVLRFPVSNGLRLAPTTVVTSNEVYTIVVLFRFDNDAVTSYKRILDFKDGTTDNGFYQNGGYLSFYVGSQIALGTTFLSTNVYHQIVLTRDAAGTVTAYADGVQEFSFDDSTRRAGVIDANNNLRFFRDNEGSPEHWSGAAARIRVFDRALSASEVAALDRRAAAPPTAALVSVGGRVTAEAGNPISRATVYLTDARGETRTATTSSFGFYRFENVPAGETYVLNVASKRYIFAPRVAWVTDQSSDLDFIAAQ